MSNEGITMNNFILTRKRHLAFLPVLIITLVFILSCTGPSSQQREKITVYQSSVSLGDPHICSDSVNRLSLIFSVYEALVKRDQAGAYQPSLAEAWDVEEDGRTWTFHLRKDVMFHNGNFLSAEDVVATLGRVLDPAIGGSFGTQGVYLSYLENAKISAIDKMTVRIVTAEPMADLLDLLVAMPVSPAGELDKLPDEYMGSGPYKIVEQNTDRTVLKAFDEYWGKAPEYRAIQWIAEPSAEKRVEALISGKADIIFGVDTEGRKQIRSSGLTDIQELESGLCIIFMCNAFEGPCCDRRVRQALNYGLDVDRIIAEIKQGAATPLSGYLTPHHFGHNPETAVYPYDPEKARSLLAEAGYENGLKLTFDIPAAMPDEAPNLARMMAIQLQEVGISVEIVTHEDRAAYSEMVRGKNIHDACCFDSSPRSTFRVLREKIQSDLRGPWWEGYENSEVNTMIEQAQATFSDTERQQIYRRIYQLIHDDAPWIFLYNPTYYWGVGPRLKDWQPRADSLLIF